MRAAFEWIAATRRDAGRGRRFGLSAPRAGALRIGPGVTLNVQSTASPAVCPSRTNRYTLFQVCHQGSSWHRRSHLGAASDSVDFGGSGMRTEGNESWATVAPPASRPEFAVEHAVVHRLLNIGRGDIRASFQVGDGA